nr:PTS sugar transporter subunit IIC [Eubacterium uniforme]
MEMIKKYLNRVFIEGLSGMALGLFATLIMGTILCQIGDLLGPGFFGGKPSHYLILIGSVAKTITGAGIGVGVASKYQESPLVSVSAAVAGMIGAFPNVNTSMAFVIGKPGEPLGAFVAAYVAIELGHIVSGKTQLDIILTPFVGIMSGGLAGIWVGKPIARFMLWVGELVNVNVDKQPIVGGLIVAVIMGMVLTLPISSAAIGISLGLSGLAAGAATIGCCCQMVGFAVASFRENKVGGLISQGVGTSMLQITNILRHPFIWIPPIVSSAILGPVGAAVLKMKSNSTGSGMGTSGLVGPIMSYQTMTKSMSNTMALAEVVVMEFVLPAIITLIIAEGMRKIKLIHDGDMKLEA